MLTFSIPAHLWDLGIDVLHLSRLAANRLLARRIKTLGQLHGLSVADIGALPGVGAKCLDEIVVAINAISKSAGAQSQQVLSEPEPAHDERLVSESPRLRVPSEVHNWPVSALRLQASTLGYLHAKGIHTIGALDGRSEADLADLHFIGHKTGRAIAAAVKELHALPDGRVFRKDSTGAPLAPHASLSFFRDVEQANTPAAEVAAILQGLTERNREMVTLRWTRHNGRQAILDEIGERYGVTRERVRQITEKRDSTLRASNLWLPQLAAVVGVLESAGGALPTHALISRAQSCGIAVDAAVLSVSESLGELGLIPLMFFSERVKLWLTPTGAKTWLDSKVLTKDLKEMRLTIRRALRWSGCLAVDKIAPAPFGLRHALSIAVRGGARLQRIGEYLLPRSTRDSAITRHAEQMLVVSPDLTFDDLISGLRKATVVSRKRRERIDVPPAPVLVEVLKRDGRFDLSEGDVRLRQPRANEEVLSPTEQIVVSTLEEHENVATWAQIIEAGNKAGAKTATISLVLREPFIVKRATGIYALRGRAITQETLRARVRERAEMKRDAVKRVSFNGGSRARVVYQLTSFSIGGVLPLPSKLRSLASRTWKARIPGGRELKVKVRRGLLWSLRQWFAEDKLKVGDLVIADFDIPNGVIELDVAS